MAEFKKGDRIVFVEDDNYEGVEMPEGTRGTYDGHSSALPLAWVRLDSGERVLAWSDHIAHAEDHGTGDGSAPDTCAAPGCNCDLERRFPAPLDPAKVKPGDTVTLERDGGRLPDQEVVVVTSTEQGWIVLILKGAVEVRVTGPDPWRLTAHQPAPEPEPEPEPEYTVAQAVWEAMLADGAEGHEVFRADKVADAIRAKFVVIDPADVDVVALQREIDDAMPGHEASVVLERLGLNR